MKNKIDSQINIKHNLFVFVVLALLLAMVAQLSFISIWGTRGKEIASIRNKQKEIILENELLEAEISKKQSLALIKQTAQNEFGMVNVDSVTHIEPSVDLNAYK